MDFLRGIAARKMWILLMTVIVCCQSFSDGKSLKEVNIYKSQLSAALLNLLDPVLAKSRLSDHGNQEVRNSNLKLILEKNQQISDQPLEKGVEQRSHTLQADNRQDLPVQSLDNANDQVLYHYHGQINNPYWGDSLPNFDDKSILRPLVAKDGETPLDTKPAYKGITEDDVVRFSQQKSGLIDTGHFGQEMTGFDFMDNAVQSEEKKTEFESLEERENEKAKIVNARRFSDESKADERNSGFGDITDLNRNKDSEDSEITNDNLEKENLTNGHLEEKNVDEGVEKVKGFDRIESTNDQQQDSEGNAIILQSLRKKRAVRFDADGGHFIAPQYGLNVFAHNVETGSNRSLDSTIERLKWALSSELKWPDQDIHVEKINFAGNSVGFYFKNRNGDLVPVASVLSQYPGDLAEKLKELVPDLEITQLRQDTGIARSVEQETPIYLLPYFPFAVAGISVGVLLLLVFVIYLAFCRVSKKVEDVDEEAVVGHAIYYPSLKPETSEPTAIQPDPAAADFASPNITTPIQTQPIRIKAKGLLERRGSNASLTLDLTPSTDLGRWEGTPPKESTALEFLMSAGNRLSRRDLRNAIKQTKLLYEEFWEIPMNHTEKVSVAGSGMKNRYKTIIPNEHSRVILPDIDNDPLNSYINANYIRGYEGEPRAYIATQGPMAHTVLDFWRMIWAERCPIIVMITKLKEKSKPKCENYIPERYGNFGDVEVIVEKMILKKGYVLRHITLRSQGTSHSLLHYWYTAWPDHKPPDSPNMLLDLVTEVELRRYHPSSDLVAKGPVCVHCSAGIGRTGCFIAISIGIRQLREEHSVDALGIVCAMRIDRGGMIQTHEQYDFMHQALAAYERTLGEPSVQSITALTSERGTPP